MSVKDILEEAKKPEPESVSIRFYGAKVKVLNRLAEIAKKNNTSRNRLIVAVLSDFVDSERKTKKDRPK